MKEENLEKKPWVLIKLAKEENKDAFDLLYKIYFIPVFRYVF